MNNIISSTFLLIFLNVITCFSQENGEWSKTNVKATTFNLNAGESKSLLIELPSGTSKFYYTIKVYKTYESTVEELKAFVNKNPFFDPRIVIATETASIATKMSDAKLTYSVISSSNNKVYDCYKNPIVIVGNHQNFFDYNDTNCIDISANSVNLKFNFESLNKLFPLKVVFESVPFIDNELKRGWSKSIKDYLYNNLVNYAKENNTENLSNSKIEERINCLMSQLTKDYSLKEFQLLAEYEKGNYFNKTIKTCN